MIYFSIIDRQINININYLFIKQLLLQFGFLIKVYQLIRDNFKMQLTDEQRNTQITKSRLDQSQVVLKSDDSDSDQVQKDKDGSEVIHTQQSTLNIDVKQNLLDENNIIQTIKTQTKEESILQKNNIQIDQKSYKVQSQKIKTQNKTKQQKDQWNNDQDLSGGQEQRQQGQYLNEYNENQQIQKTAIYEQNDIKHLADYQDSSILNNGVIQSDPLTLYEHMVQNKHLMLLYLLFRRQIFTKFPRSKTRHIDIHPANRNKIKIYGRCQQQIKQVSIFISQTIKQNSIVKLNIKGDEAFKMKNSKNLCDTLLKKKMIIFRYGHANDKSYYLGGRGTQSQLFIQFKQIRNYRFKYFRVFAYSNTRSYKIIMENFVNNKLMLKSFNKWGTRALQIVPYIPSMNRNQPRQMEKSLCFLMTNVGASDAFSPKQMEIHIQSFVKNNYYCITLIMKKTSNHLPKLKVQNITFKYLDERKLNRCYIYIMCHKTDYFNQREDIIKELQKLEDKNTIYGARFFKHISPQFNEYIKPQAYKAIPYPSYRPYSYVIVPKMQQIKEQTQQMKTLEAIETVETVEIKEIQNKTRQISKQFGTFDWRGHLRAIHSTQASFYQ